MRHSLGLAVFAGMLGVTLFGIFLTPVFFFVLQWFGGTKSAPQSPSESTPPNASSTALIVRPAEEPHGVLAT